MRTPNTLAWMTIAALSLAGCTTYRASPPVPANFAQGLLVGPNQMTLYTFDKDAAGSGKSVCNGPCATNWPPLLAEANAQPSGDFSVVTRDDGRKQWALKGRPLYFWAKDQKPGDATGDGFNQVWHAVRP